MRRGEQSKVGMDALMYKDGPTPLEIQCTQASGMGSIPIARSINHDDSTVLTSLTY
jgi:hypothetical protein